MRLLMRGFELGEDWRQGRMGGQLGGFDLLAESMLLLTQGLLLFDSGGSGALERLELLLQAFLLRLEGRIGRDGLFIGGLQLGFLSVGEDVAKAMMMVASGRAGGRR